MASCPGSPAPAGAGPREAWDATVERLAGGILDGDGALTTAGATFRAEIEDRTSRLGHAPWAALGAEGRGPLGELGGGLARALVAAGCFPEGIMAAGR